MLRSSQFGWLFAFVNCFLSATSAPHHGRDADISSIPVAESADMIELKFSSGIRQPGIALSKRNLPQLSSVAQNSDGDLSVYRFDQAYLAPVTIGTQEFFLAIDTGSSDTWVADSFFQCQASGFSDFGGQDACGLGKTFERRPNDTSITPLLNQHFALQYADYSGAVGPMIKAPLKLGSSLTFDQEIGIANLVAWTVPDNVTSGVLGLAHPSLTNKYPGTDVYKDLPCPLNGSTVLYYGGEARDCNQIEYSAVMQSANTSMTFALSRSKGNSSYGGSMSFKGFPRLSEPKVNATGRYVAMKMESLAFDTRNRLGFHVISVDAVLLPVAYNATADLATSPSISSFQTSAAGKRNAVRHSSSRRSFPLRRAGSSTAFHAISNNSSDGKNQFIIDSGSTVSYFPAPIARAYHSLFDPPTFKSHSGDGVRVNCTGLNYLPPFQISIKGQSFLHNPEDMIVRFQVEKWNTDAQEYRKEEVCYSAIQEAEIIDYKSGATANVLGQPFFKNTLVYLDTKNKYVGIISRPYYES